MIPYYNPNIFFNDLFVLFTLKQKESEKALTEYYKKITGKKYVLFTNSCRSALSLIYKTIIIEGEVITTPLTCSAAIEPIKNSGCTVKYVDINIETLNIDCKLIESKITNKTRAIQLIHLGGVPCNINAIKEITTKHNILLIEDCAQSQGSYYKGNHTGSFGDIACFSLIKNAYGIGGGVIATDSYAHFKELKETLNLLTSNSFISDSLRLFYNLLASYRHNFFLKSISSFLFTLKKRRSKNKASQIILRKPSKLQILVAYRQSQKLKDLHQKRKEIGVILINKMIKRNIMENRIPNLEDITISKLFVFNKNFYYKDIVNFFKENSIEVMHLSHKSGSPYQPMLMSMEEAAVFELKNYLSIHDSIVSLPLIEDMDNKEIDLILDLFCEYLNKRKC